MARMMLLADLISTTPMDGRIDAVVTVQVDITQTEELQLIQKIDLDLIENAEINDDNFNITFFKPNTLLELIKSILFHP